MSNPTGRRAAMRAANAPGGRSTGTVPAAGGGRGAGGRGRGLGVSRAAAAPPAAPGGALSPEEKEEKPSPPQRGSPMNDISPPPELGEKKEDSVVDKMKQLSIDSQKLSPRPDHCSVGRVIPLSTNHFYIKFRETQNILIERYSVEVRAKAGDKKKLNKEEKRHAFWRCVADNKTAFTNNYGCAYDGESICFTTNKLNLTNGAQSFEFTHTLPRDDRPTTVVVSLSYTGVLYIDMKKVTDFQEKENTSIQAIDIVFRQGRLCPYVQSPFVPTIRSFYKPNSPQVDLGGGREVWSGYYSAGHVGMGWKPILNVDVTHTAFFKQQSVIGFLCEVMNKHTGRGGPRGGQDQWHPRNLGQRTMDSQQCRIFTNQIKGLRVTVRHQGEERADRAYKVIQSTVESAEQLRFDTEDFGNVSVAQYFDQRYNIRLQYPNLPCLWVGSRRKNIRFPLELCEVRMGQKSSAKLDDDSTTKMIKFACKNAVERKQQIMDMVATAAFHNDDWVKTFGLDFDPQMIKLNGRVLPPPRMEYGQGQTCDVRGGVWNNRGEIPFYEPATIDGYGLITLLPDSKQSALENFCRSMKRQATALGMKMPEYPHTVRFIRSARDVKSAMEAILGSGKKTDLIVVALGARQTDVYSEIKRVSEIELGIMTQCALPRTIHEPKPATLSNLLNKINTKLGGINTRIAPSPAWSKMMMDEPTLVLALDVTHPGPLDKKSPSVASMVGNIDLEFNRFAASVKVQSERREHIIHAQDMFRDRIVAFFQKTQRKPEKIIIYRDGVSEGQFKRVLYEEMGGVREVCKSLDANYQPRITFVVVQKRHHTRFFCEDRADETGKARNVPPGTLVDTEIVHPEYFDFFLCSHFGIQGTSRPTHYIVLHDDSEFTANKIQMMTYYLCHIYCRCARTVSIPAPVYYADLVCTRARAHLFEKIQQISDSASSSGSGGHGDGGTETHPVTNSSASDHELTQAVMLNTTNEFNTTMYYV